MLIFYILLIVISFWKCKFSKKLFFGEESFSKNVTDSVKGIFIWLVFLSHFTNYTTYTSPIDIYGRAISSLLGQLIVACFSFIPDLAFIIKLLTAPAFCLVIIVFLTKFKISNKILIFSGQYLFEIYILQRIPMILLKELELAKFNHYLYFVLCLALTVIIALIFRRITNKADSYLFKTNNKHLSNHTTVDN